MNLNDGDTLRAIQTLEKEVQESQQIRLALDIFTALNSNNYVRFVVST